LLTAPILGFLKMEDIVQKLIQNGSVEKVHQWFPVWSPSKKVLVGFPWISMFQLWLKQEMAREKAAGERFSDFLGLLWSTVFTIPARFNNPFPWRLNWLDLVFLCFSSVFFDNVAWHA
jgi:hypothetical protein